MDQGFSILMFIFAGALLFYAALMAITKDYKMLPFRARVSVKPKNAEKYMVALAKVVALTGVAIALGAAIALWNQMVGGIVMLVGVIVTLFASPKLMEKVL